jgi:PAS domain S-box-containing protein
VTSRARDDRSPAALSQASRAVPWVGVLLALLILGAIAWLGWAEYHEKVETGRSRVELLARVLEDHATRTVETTSIALGSLSELLATQSSGGVTEVGPLLSQALVGLPFLRSLAVVDAQGQVLTTTAARDFGRVVDVRVLGPWPAADREQLGGYVAGRGLADLASGGPAAPAGVGFIPLLRGIRLRDDVLVSLVALINPDAFSNQQQLTLDDALSGALLASFDGTLLSTTPSVRLAPGTRLADHPVYRDYLPAREHGSYVGRGARGQAQVVAFRVSRSRPLVLLVEHPLADVRATWWAGLRSFVALAAVLLVFVAGMTLTAWRSLRSREATRLLLDQAQAEVALRERELSVTIKSVQDLIFRTDERGAITFVNERWMAIGGDTAQTALGRQLHELVLPEQRDAVRALFSADTRLAVRQAQATVPGEGAHRTRHFDVAVVPLMRKDRIVGFAGSAADVTDRVVAQQKLQTQLTISALMLEISPLPLSMLDTLGRYLSVNQAWEDFTGRRREDVIGQAAASYLPPEEAAIHNARDRELLASGGRISYEASVTHRDGSRRDVVLIKVAVPGDDGGPSGVLTVLMDVSEFRAAERATREARDAAEEASRAKSEFIANISHELRTPLQSILGFSELGIMRGRAAPKLASMFTDIHSSGQRMLALVNDLLDVSKIESTVGTFHLERTDLRTLVREVARELEPLLAAPPAALALALANCRWWPRSTRCASSRCCATCWPTRSSSRLPRPHRGEGETTAAGEIHIAVRDHGPGIPPAEIERSSRPSCSPARPRTARAAPAWAWRSAARSSKAHGGRIHAENLAGGGTVFHIHVPARGSTETAPVPLYRRQGAQPAPGRRAAGRPGGACRASVQLLACAGARDAAPRLRGRARIARGLHGGAHRRRAVPALQRAVRGGTRCGRGHRRAPCAFAARAGLGGRAGPRRHRVLELPRPALSPAGALRDRGAAGCAAPGGAAARPVAAAPQPRDAARVAAAVTAGRALPRRTARLPGLRAAALRRAHRASGGCRVLGDAAGARSDPAGALVRRRPRCRCVGARLGGRTRPAGRCAGRADRSGRDAAALRRARRAARHDRGDAAAAGPAARPRRADRATCRRRAGRAARRAAPAHGVPRTGRETAPPLQRARRSVARGRRYTGGTALICSGLRALYKYR